MDRTESNHVSQDSGALADEWTKNKLEVLQVCQCVQWNLNWWESKENLQHSATTDSAWNNATTARIHHKRITGNCTEIHKEYLLNEKRMLSWKEGIQKYCRNYLHKTQIQLTWQFKGWKRFQCMSTLLWWFIYHQIIIVTLITKIVHRVTCLPAGVSGPEKSSFTEYEWITPGSTTVTLCQYNCMTLGSTTVTLCQYNCMTPGSTTVTLCQYNWMTPGSTTVTLCQYNCMTPGSTTVTLCQYNCMTPGSTTVTLCEYNCMTPTSTTVMQCQHCCVQQMGTVNMKSNQTKRAMHANTFSDVIL